MKNTIMEIANHEHYVSLEVANLLKEAGFDWPTHYSYDLYLYSTEGEMRVIDGFASICNEHNNFASMPTLEIAQRWLREEKSIYIGITAIENKRAVTNSDGWTFHYEYGKPTFDCDIKDERCEDMCTLYDSFDTYEEAQEAGIMKALEIILEL